MWGGNQISDEWGKGEFVFERSRVRVSGGSVVWTRYGPGDSGEGYGRVMRVRESACFCLNVGKRRGGGC